MSDKYVVHCKKEPYDVYVGRPSKWGNPFSHRVSRLAEFKVATVEEAIASYEAWVVKQPHLMRALHQLTGKVLGCWCDPGPCHAHVLVRLSNLTPAPLSAIVQPPNGRRRQWQALPKEV